MNDSDNIFDFDDLDDSGLDAFGGDDVFSADSFGEDTSFGGNSQGFGNNTSSNISGGGFNSGDVSDDLFSRDTNNDEAPVGKKSIIIVIVGIVGILLVLLLGNILLKATSKDENTVNTAEQTVQQPVQQPVNTEADILYDNSNKEKVVEKTTTVTKVVDGNENWIEITDNENVTFQDEYIESVFTITGVKHYARATDINNNIYIKTTLTGSLSGMSGTYYIDVPYSKGVKLNVGQYFNVQVQIGSYGDKLVIGDIKY